MNYWQTLYNYYLERGFPRDLIIDQSINPDDAYWIINTISTIRPKSILEVGTFIGLSTGIIAFAKDDDCRLVCVDPNLPINVQSIEFDYYDNRRPLDLLKETLRHFNKHQQIYILEGFFSCYPCGGFEKHLQSHNVDFRGIHVVGREIEDYAPYEVVFLDGDHYSEAVYSDLSLIHDAISAKSVIILHDISGGWANQVQAGVQAFLRDHIDYSMTVKGGLGFLRRE